MLLSSRISSVIYSIRAVALFWESPRCPCCPPPPASSSWFHSNPCSSSPFRFCLSLPLNPAPRNVWAAAASRRLGPPTLPAAVPGSAASGKGPQGGKSPYPAGLLHTEPSGCGGSGGGITVGDWWFFLPGGLSVPFLLPVFPPHPSQKSLLFSWVEFNMTWFLVPSTKALFLKLVCLCFYYLVSIPHKIVLNGKTRNFTKPKVAVLFWSISCSFQWSRGCIFFLVTRRSVMPRCWQQSAQSCPSLLLHSFGLLF